MLRPIAITAVVLPILLWSSDIVAQNTCVKCRLDSAATIAGCQYSCGMLGCDEPCNGTSPEIAYLDAPQPGFFVEQRQGKKWVESIVPRSPASYLLSVGDELVAINRGKPLTCRPSWESFSGSGTAKLIVRRNGFEVEQTIKLESARVLLDKAWLKEASEVKSVSLTENPRTRSYGLYGFGLYVQRSDDHFVVSELLPGSPAQLIGISIGDTLTSIDGLTSRASSEEGLQSRLWPTTRAWLSVVQASTGKELRLRAVSTRELLQGLGSEPQSASPTVASVY